MTFMTSHWLARSRRLSTMASPMPILLANERLRATEPTSGETTTMSETSSNLSMKYLANTVVACRLSTGMSKKP